jgi:hypothetical protein
LCQQQVGVSLQLGCHQHLQADNLSPPYSIGSTLEPLSVGQWSNVAAVDMGLMMTIKLNP